MQYAKFVSYGGTLVFNTIIDLWIVHTFGSSNILGQTMAIASSATFICSIFGGYIADSKYLLAVIKGINLISGILCLAFVGLYHYQTHLDLWQVNTAVFLLNVNAYLSSPIFKKMVNFFVKREAIMTFNQTMALGTQVLSVTVPPISTFLYGWHWLSLPMAFLLNGLSFFGAFFFLKPFTLTEQPSHKFVGYRQTFTNIFSNPTLLQFLFMGVMLNFFLAGLNIFFPIMVIRQLHEGHLYGAVLASQAVGGIVGSYSISKIPITKSLTFERIGLVVISLVLLLLTILQTIAFIFVVAVVISIVLSRYNIASQTIVQREVDSALIGKTFSAIFIFANIASPIGNLSFGYINGISMNLTLIVVAVGFVIFNLMWIMIDRRYQKRSHE
ncbi:MFS transporter [Periweissella ghanensis]|uniref:MFS transporter n=1 Tax=Periweissella ghanensis TaxID=467997 RepID=UPI0025B70AA1|nr:MFS transporter [Periweissella ghanensis]